MDTPCLNWADPPLSPRYSDGGGLLQPDACLIAPLSEVYPVVRYPPWRIGCSSRSSHTLLGLSGARCELFQADRLRELSKEAGYSYKTLTNADRSAADDVHATLHSVERVGNGLGLGLVKVRWANDGTHTSNSLDKAAIFFEYSRSATRTLFSICSVLVWTSLRIAMSLSTAVSNVRINGLGSNAVKA